MVGAAGDTGNLPQILVNRSQKDRWSTESTGRFVANSKIQVSKRTYLIK